MCVLEPKAGSSVGATGALMTKPLLQVLSLQNVDDGLVLPNTSSLFLKASFHQSGFNSHLSKNSFNLWILSIFLIAYFSIK